jgi:hypothetical protein
MEATNWALRRGKVKRRSLPASALKRTARKSRYARKYTWFYSISNIYSINDLETASNPFKLMFLTIPQGWLATKT